MTEDVTDIRGDGSNSWDGEAQRNKVGGLISVSQLLVNPESLEDQRCSLLIEAPDNRLMLRPDVFVNTIGSFYEQHRRYGLNLEIRSKTVV